MSSIRSEIADREMMVVVKTHHFGDVRILQCAGRITCGCADTFRIAVLRQPRVPLVVLDFAAVSRIDAAGLGILVSLHTWAARETAKHQIHESDRHGGRAVSNHTPELCF